MIYYVVHTTITNNDSTQNLSHYQVFAKFSVIHLIAALVLALLQETHLSKQVCVQFWPALHLFPLLQTLLAGQKTKGNKRTKEAKGQKGSKSTKGTKGVTQKGSVTFFRPTSRTHC